jgi:hypothetical protein
VFESIGRENRWRNFWLFDEVNLEWLWLLVIGAGALSGLSFYTYRFIIWPVFVLLALVAYLVPKLSQKGQIVVIRDDGVSVEGNQGRRSLRWNEITEAHYYKDDEKKWLFIDANQRPFILKLEGFSFKDCQEMKELIIVKLQLKIGFRK